MYKCFGKRAVDMLVAVIVAIPLLPLLALVALLVRCRLGSPVLFRQPRAGWKGRPFVLNKFRTMRDARDRKGEPLPDAERLTPLGVFLRNASLDELPQLWNVIRGDMSLVGPRPLLVEYLPRYSPHQARRHEVRPGITGWAQVNGRNTISWEDRFDLDVWYVDHLSWWLDVRILWRTALRVIRPQDINAAGSATMPKFLGSTAPDPAATNSPPPAVNRQEAK